MCVFMCLCVHMSEETRRNSLVSFLFNLFPLSFLSQGPSLTCCSLVQLTWLSRDLRDLFLFLQWDHKHTPLFLVPSHGFWRLKLGPHTYMAASSALDNNILTKDLCRNYWQSIPFTPEVYRACQTYLTPS